MSRLLKVSPKHLETVKLALLRNSFPSQDEIEKLIEILGGHPYLIRLAMYHLSQSKVSLKINWHYH